MDLHLENKTALVTGSSRGTGAAIANALAGEGAFVFVHGISRDEGSEVADAISAARGDCALVSGDITNDDGAEELSRQVSGHGRPVDIVVNNYGLASGGSWKRSASDVWIDDYQRNVLSAVRVSRLFLAAMKDAGWGRIVQIGSVGSTRPNARMPGYYAAKAALAAMTVSLSKELAQTGITVNTVSPGLIRTPEVEAHFMEVAKKKGWGSTWEDIEPRVVSEFMDNPTGRIARREDIAILVAFLASPLASHINGQNIRIDGGSVDIV